MRVRLVNDQRAVAQYDHHGARISQHDDDVHRYCSHNVGGPCHLDEVQPER